MSMEFVQTILETKNLGLLVIGISILLAFVLIPPSIRIATSDAAKCIHDGGLPCPWTTHLPIEFYFGLGFIITLIIIGSVITLRLRKKEKMDKELTMMINETKRKLQDDERKIYDVITDNEGVIFQSDLVEKIGFPKVKVSRILDKLEGKGLIERRRRGLNNVIVAKYR